MKMSYIDAPWHTVNYGYEKNAILNERGGDIGFAHRRTHAENIVKCVNSHDDLVEALLEARVYVPEHHGPIMHKINAALAKAGVK